MQNITVTRYENQLATGYIASITPEDNAWSLFIDRDNKPSLYVEKSVVLAPGKTIRCMVNVEHSSSVEKVSQGPGQA